MIVRLSVLFRVNNLYNVYSIMKLVCVTTFGGDVSQERERKYRQLSGPDKATLVLVSDMSLTSSSSLEFCCRVCVFLNAAVSVSFPSLQNQLLVSILAHSESKPLAACIRIPVAITHSLHTPVVCTAPEIWTLL